MKKKQENTQKQYEEKHENIKKYTSKQKQRKIKRNINKTFEK